MSGARLFSPLRLRELEFRNRIFVSPMCQYSAVDGMPTDWHLVHLGSRAVGGAALVMTEATAVSPEGRITPFDTGIWSREQAAEFRKIAGFIRQHGAVAGIQIAHAGRKASTDVPWRGGKPVDTGSGGWQPVAPSPVPFVEGYAVPREMTEADMERVRAAFAASACHGREAGFEVVEVHMAHGYLLHEFLSPLTNRRTDAFGGSLENRLRFPVSVARAVRAEWPERLPVFVRVSATDWVEGGWDLPQTVALARELKTLGIDMVDCSSGGTVPDAVVPAGPGFQAPFAAAVRREAGIATGAVGLITEPAQAEEMVSTGQADAILIGREFLRDPYWPLHAARTLGVDVPWPSQYERAKLS
ncbi:MAG: NADH:flavin oxidoreductase/NADH oxidase [Deltaproteobacteria bacterium]|nr:MAG: NADH:flavin oxidoreductase/NADH oxidase [Deltaproteobacteria bacterium]